ncbi:helix-turn-helix domain-containing protein [Xenorhabdus bovienii]
MANRLGFHPSHIWPSRYFDNMGRPIKRRPRNLNYMGDTEI